MSEPQNIIVNVDLEISSRHPLRGIREAFLRQDAFILFDGVLEGRHGLHLEVGGLGPTTVEDGLRRLLEMVDEFDQTERAALTEAEEIVFNIGVAPEGRTSGSISPVCSDLVGRVHALRGALVITVYPVAARG